MKNIIQFIRKYFLLLLFVAIIACLIFWRHTAKVAREADVANYLKDVAVADAFLESAGVSLYADAWQPTASMGRKIIEFSLGSSGVVAYANNGIWYENNANDTLVYQSFDGELLYEIDIRPLDVIDTIHMSGDGRYVVYSGWFSIGLSDMSTDQVYICDLSTGKKKLLFQDAESAGLSSVKLSHNGDIVYYISDGTIYSYDVDSAEVSVVAAGYEVFPFDNGNVGIIQYDNGLAAKVVGPGSIETVFYNDRYFHVVDWDSTGRFFAYLGYGHYGPQDKHKIERVPHVFDIATGNNYRCNYGYFSSLHIHYDEENVHDSGGVTIFIFK